jgi:anti-anti-sigma factor
VPVAGSVLAAGTADGASVVLTGELDADGAARLRATLEDTLAPRAVVTLDLARVDYLSQPALAVLVQAHRRLRDSGGALVLASVSEPVERLLRISGLHRVFEVADGQLSAEPDARQAAGA